MPTQLFNCMLCGALLLFSSCSDDKDVWSKGSVKGYVPVYNTDPGLKRTIYQHPREGDKPTDIFATGNYILALEPDSGLHVISFQQPVTPKNIGFIRIPGIRTAVVKGNYLYANNYDDLVTIALNGFTNVTETGLVNRAWHLTDYPPYKDVYFECVDSNGYYTRM